MLVELTYACKMGCKHCLSDCKPDGENMSVDTLKDVLEFMSKNNIIPWIFSGGEMFEHPDIINILKTIEEYWDGYSKHNRLKFPIMFITNGRELVRNQDIFNLVSDIQKRHSKRFVQIQITDDPRFYPDPLTDKEKYRLNKLSAIIEPVPSNLTDKNKCLYPQGRALENYPDADWNTIAPRCANCRLIAKQDPNISLSYLVETLLNHGKMCTPQVSPDGHIKVGESALCPVVASIYDRSSDIVTKIRQCNCQACKIPWERLKESNKMAYKILTD